jgi:hypothetical protein
MLSVSVIIDDAEIVIGDLQRANNAGIKNMRIALIPLNTQKACSPSLQPSTLKRTIPPV